MTHQEAFDKYSEELVKCLPINDTFFIAKLSTFNLLPGNTSNQLEALPTQADKAMYFLNHVIKPALAINDASSFENLLSVMEQCGYIHVRKIACQIKSQMSKANDIESGTYVCMNIYIHTCMYHTVSLCKWSGVCTLLENLVRIINSSIIVSISLIIY